MASNPPKRRIAPIPVQTTNESSSVEAIQNVLQTCASAEPAVLPPDYGKDHVSQLAPGRRMYFDLLGSDGILKYREVRLPNNSSHVCAISHAANIHAHDHAVAEEAWSRPKSETSNRASPGRF